MQAGGMPLLRTTYKLAYKEACILYYRISISLFDIIKFVMQNTEASRNLFLGFIKLHILHHAAIEEVFGLAMIQELQRHGYSLSPGTLYPLLHKMQEKGLLRSRSETVSGKVRKYYRITKEGEKALAAGYRQATELIDELKEHHTIKEKR